VINLKGGKIKTITTSLLLVVFIPSLTFAGEIYGSIKVGNSPVRRGVVVEVRPDTNKQKPYYTRIGRYGSYSLYVPEKGRCILKVYYKQPSSLKIAVYSYDEPVQYDLFLEKINGQYFLRRE
jgi:hypothetical protein